MAIPEYPISRVEHYLARANGQNITPPDPISRIEHYLAGIAGGVPQELLDDVANLKSQMDQKAPAIMQTVSNQAIASFADGADDMPLKSLTVAINPVQAGTGDPSPENVRPITGWTGAKVTRTGKNLFDGEWLNGYWDASNGEFITSDTWRSCKQVKCKASSYYYISGLNTTSGSINGYILFWDANGVYLGYRNPGMPVEPYANSAYMAFYTAATTITDVCQLEEGNSATAYEPYQGNTYDVSWETEAGTVYGGTLDVVSGVLTVTHKAVDLGSLSWTSLGGAGVFGTVITDIYNRERNTPNNAACEAFTGQNEWLAASLTDGHFMIRGDTKTVYFRNNNFTDNAESFKESVSNVTFVYALQTAITYQLTPVEVKTLLGQNNIFADTGNVSVVYPADTKTYIDNQIAALQALILENISNS